MSEKQNAQTIADIYAAFGRGDVPFILDQLTDDVKWVAHLDSVVPWGGDFSGKKRVPAFFDAIFGSVDVELFEPQDSIAQGDNLASVGAFAFKSRSTGKSARTRWTFLWRFRDGKVCYYEQFQSPEVAAAFR